MHQFKRHLALAALIVAGVYSAIDASPAAAWNRGDVETFAVLPKGAPKVEGLTVGADGNVYVSTFDPTAQSGHAQLFVFDKNSGRQVGNVTIRGASPATLGLAFHPTTHELLVIDFGAGQVLSVNPTNGSSTVCIVAPNLGKPPGPGLNALTFDTAGNIYVSDSFQGVIWKATGCGAAPSMWASDALLLPDGIPPFGANGIAFNKAGDAMFVANTSTDKLIRIGVDKNTGKATDIQEFTNSINGADGIVIDGDDNIWVAANQADEIVVVDPTGKAIAKLGDFDGVKHGVTNGLLFPASPAFSRDGKWLYVSNLELDLRSIGGPQTVDSQWAAQVQQHSVARLRARIPNIQGD